MHKIKSRRFLPSLTSLALLASTVGASVVLASPAAAVDPVVLPDQSDRLYTAAASASTLYFSAETDLYSSSNTIYGPSPQVSSTRTQKRAGFDGYVEQTQHEARHSSAIGILTTSAFGDRSEGHAVAYNKSTATNSTPAFSSPSISTGPISTTVTSGLNNDGNLPAPGEFLSASTTSGLIDPAPLETPGGDVIDLLTKTGTTTNDVSLSFTDLPDSDKYGLSGNAHSGLATYTLLDGQVTVEVLEELVITASVTGDGTQATTSTGKIRVTGPENEVTVLDMADGQAPLLMFQDPTNPDRSMQVSFGSQKYVSNQGNEVTVAAGGQATYFETVDTVEGPKRLQFSTDNLISVNLSLGLPLGGINSSSVPDSDNDGLNDFVESQIRTRATIADTDNDGLQDGLEFNTLKTDPKDTDTDNDRLLDGAEVNTHKSNPLAVDSDNDGKEDGDEIDFGSNPIVGDEDGDTLPDWREMQLKTDPHKADTDNDGLSDSQEIRGWPTSDPTKYDTDGGGTHDGIEASFDMNPRDPADDYRRLDTDNDGLNGDEEENHGTDPFKADSDGDSLLDGDEVRIHRTDPNLFDTDEDELSDGYEINHNLNPLLADTDGDGVNDGAEIIAGTDPLAPPVVTPPSTPQTPNVPADVDNDGLLDSEELALGTNPNKADTDNDGLSDAIEVRGT